MRTRGMPPGFKLIGSKPGIDPEILPMVRELNWAGYRTCSSCAGHGITGRNRGQVTIYRTPTGYQTGFNGRGGINSLHKRDIAKIILIMKKHGLRNIRFEYPADLTFTGIGKHEVKKKVKRCKCK